MSGIPPRFPLGTEAFILIASGMAVSKVRPSPQGQPTSSDRSMQRPLASTWEPVKIQPAPECPMGVGWGLCCDYMLADSSLWPILPVTSQKSLFLRALAFNLPACKFPPRGKALSQPMRNKFPFSVEDITFCIWNYSRGPWEETT